MGKEEGKECVVYGNLVSNIIFHVIVECQESKNSDNLLRNRGQEVLTKKEIKDFMLKVNRRTLLGIVPNIQRWRNRVTK